MSLSHRGTLMLFCAILTLAATSPASGFGPGEAAGSPRPARPAGAVASRADFIVLVWYRRNDPLGTFQDQVYDVRKGEYTKAVNHWVEVMRTKYPGYDVHVHAVDLGREHGATEKLKLGSVIHRELLVAAAQSGVFLGAPVNISQGPSSGQSRAPRFDRMPTPNRVFLNPDPNRLLIPVYPRTRTP